MKTVIENGDPLKIGRFTIMQDRDTYALRWYDDDTKKQKSKAVGKDLDKAKAEAYRRMAALVRPSDVIEDEANPTFGELWHFYKREKMPTLSSGRAALLEIRWRLYFKPKLAEVRASRITPAIRALRDDLLGGWVGENRDKIRGIRKKPLHSDTIKDIINIATEVVNFTREKKLVAHNHFAPSIDVAGYIKPLERDPKGRHLSFKEMGKLIDACEEAHHLVLLLLVLSSGMRVGAFLDLMVHKIWWHLDALNTLPDGSTQKAKYRPVLPLTGPLPWALKAAIETAGPDRHVVHYRAEGLRGRNTYQIINRIAVRALGEEGAERVNFYSLRHTLIDWLKLRVPARSLSAIAGHIEMLDVRERRIISMDDGSPTTRIYQRETLAYLDPIRKALDEEWWPAIQAHCKTDLKLGKPFKKPAASVILAGLADAAQMQYVDQEQ